MFVCLSKRAGVWMYLVIEVRLCVFSSTTFLEKEKKEEKGRTYMYNVYVDFRAYLYHQQISMFILTLLNNLFRKWVKKTEKIHGLPLPISNSFPSPSPPSLALSFFRIFYGSGWAACHAERGLWLSYFHHYKATLAVHCPRIQTTLHDKHTCIYIFFSFPQICFNPFRSPTLSCNCSSLRL